MSINRSNKSSCKRLLIVASVAYFNEAAATFSCGSRWSTAKQCNQLCTDGSDSSCPIGQHCYAGIPCDDSSTSSQQMMEEEKLMERLIQQRDTGVKKEFVCGFSFDEAESSCNGSAAGNSDSSSSDETADNMMMIHYCHSGQSSECPANMQCYASVACKSPSSRRNEQQQPVISFRTTLTPTANNVTPIIQQDEEDEDRQDNHHHLTSSSLLNNVVVTMGSKIWSSLF